MNEQNLIPANKRSQNEARENGRKGGIASGEARRDKKQLLTALLDLYEMENDSGLSGVERIAAGLFAKAEAGDLNTAVWIAKTVEGKRDYPETLCFGERRFYDDYANHRK